MQPCNTSWERADLLALLCVVFSCVSFVTFPYGVLGQVLYLIVSIPYLCLPLYSVEHNYFLSKLPTLTDLLPLHYFFESKMTNRRYL